MSNDPRTRRTVSALRSALRESLSTAASMTCRSASSAGSPKYREPRSTPTTPAWEKLLTTMLIEEIDAPLGLPETDEMSITELAASFQKTLVEAFWIITRDRALFRAAFESSTSSHLWRSLEANFTRRLKIALTVWRRHGVAHDAFDPVAIPFAAAGLSESVKAWTLSDGDDPAAWADHVRDQMPPWWPRES
ncbi:hypothetical protein [Aeromicrobium sp. UC242_57]|uniref:hypothetical protein n=1 Tax=Aeromicrobium sp. UC242_57 TaxID=3374624 RepID=UPI0037A9F0CF